MKKTILITLLLLLFNCKTFYGSYAVASSKDVDFSKNFEKVKDEAKGSNEIPIYFMFPVGTLSETENINTCLERALTESEADFLKNVEIYAESFYIPFVYGKVTTTVKGEAWKEKAGAAVPAKKK